MSSRLAISNDAVQGGWWLGALILLWTAGPASLGSATPHALFIVGGLWAILDIARHRSLPRPEGLSRAFLAVLGVQIGLAALVGDRPADLAYGFNLAALLAYVVLGRPLGLVQRPNPRSLLAAIALAGALVAAVATDIAAWGLGLPRGGFGLINPNQIAGHAVLVGFLALVGFDRDRRTSWGFLLGPMAAALVLLATEARGALLAFLALVPVAYWLVGPKQGRLPILAGLGAGLLVAILLLGQFGVFARLDSVWPALGGFKDPTTIADHAIRERVLLYQAALAAFADAPWFGHGWGNFMQAAAQYLPETPDRAIIAGLPQLHNDVANFGVSGGVVGLFCLLALWVAPLVAVRGLWADPAQRWRAVGVVLIVVGYMVRGLTDLMLGFEYGTVFYALSLVLVLRLGRGVPAPRP